MEAFFTFYTMFSIIYWVKICNLYSCQYNIFSAFYWVSCLRTVQFVDLIQQLGHHWRLFLTQAFLFILFLFVHRFTIHSHCLHLKVYEDVKLITKHYIFNSTIIFLRLHNPGWLYFFNGHAVKSSMHYEHLNYSPNSYIWLTGLPCWAVEIALECSWRVLQVSPMD